jgi:glycosidase
MNFNQVFYQIYPLGFCDAPHENDGVQAHRIRKVLDWIPHLKKLGITAVYFGPVFESDRHGYDTRDYARIDCRLGTNEDFAEVCNALHDQGIKVVLDGVFNHVGRGFFGFQDVLAKKWESRYTDWFYIDYGNNGNQDGFTYGNWEGHNELVKLNLQNPDVVRYLLERIDQWIAEFDIDGLRLDVAYCLDQNFIRQLHHHLKDRDPEFFLLGEMIGGDYNVLLKEDMLDSVTNYECRKGLFSSMNSRNLFEIGYSLNRQFGSDPWCLYRGKHLLTFADNHDVDRLASVLSDPKHDLALTYDLMFAMPGIPCIYYGSEWGARGKRSRYSDDPLRPSFEKPEWNDLTEHLSELAHMRTAYPVFTDGDYFQISIQNQQLCFRRRNDHGQLTFAMNIDDQPREIACSAEVSEGIDLLEKSAHAFSGTERLDAKSSKFWYSSWD